MKFLLIAGFAESVLVFRGPLIRALMSSGCTVHVAAPGLVPGSALHRTLLDMGVVAHDIRLRRSGINPFEDVGTFLHLRRLMKTVRPDVALGYTIKPVIYGAFAARLAGVPRFYALITGLGHAFMNERKDGLLRRLVQGLYAAALKHAKMVFFQNPDDEALFRAIPILHQKTPSKVINGSGVDIDMYQLASIPAGAPSFLLIARLLGDKGIREYVAAARLVRLQHPHIRFSLVGWIDENPSAVSRHELDEWIREGTIDYLGRLSDVRPAIADSSVYVLPSYREGTPRTVLEAMAMGRPVITTDAPGCRETVQHGVNGFLVPVKAVDELAAAMLEFIENPELVQSMGRASRRLVQEKYDVNKVNEVMLRSMGIAA
nr:glycosyltransferase family 4 protein [Pseudomonas sp.]